MASSPYAVSLGRLKPDFASFLSKDVYTNLLNARDVEEVTKQLEGTPYAAQLHQARAEYRGVDLLELAINRTLVERNRHAYDAAPFAGRPAVGAYLRRWDVQNISLVLAAKAHGRTLTESEIHLVSGRNIPAGLFAGTMTFDDFRVLLEQPSLEAVASQLVRFGYGGTILPLLESYTRSGDLFALVHALEREYYRNLLDAGRFFQGDEWVVREFIRSEIDQKNVLLAIKGKDAEVPLEAVRERVLDGGNIPRSAIEDAYSARGVPELVEAFQSRYPSLPEGTEPYRNERSLTGYESALARDRALGELKRMRTYPLSLAVIFTYLLLAELERTDLQRIVFGKLYGIPATKLEPLLVMPRL